MRYYHSQTIRCCSVQRHSPDAEKRRTAKSPSTMSIPTWETSATCCSRLSLLPIFPTECSKSVPNGPTIPPTVFTDWKSRCPATSALRLSSSRRGGPGRVKRCAPSTITRGTASALRPTPTGSGWKSPMRKSVSHRRTVPQSTKSVSKRERTAACWSMPATERSACRAIRFREA